MARLPRYPITGQPQHVIQRGNNRGATFFRSDDYRLYRDCLKSACAKHGCSVHAYVLMTNHVHLLLTPDSPLGIGKVMQSVGRRYVQYVNQRYGRTGTLWEGRYKSTLVDSDEYLLACYRYIELNPIRAGLVDHPDAYPWSSFRMHANGEFDDLIRDHALYVALGKTNTARQEEYRTLILSRLEPATLDLIRESTNKAWALGSASFRAQVGMAEGRRANPLPRGGLRKPSGKTVNRV